MEFQLNQNLYPAVFNNDFIGFERAAFFGKTFARGDVKAPAVQVAFDDLAVKARIGERIAFVRAEIFDRRKLSIDVKKRDFLAVLELDGRAAPRRNGFRLSDRDQFSFTRGFSFVFPML